MKILDELQNDKSRWNLAGAVLFAVAFILINIHFFINPRFWAEDGEMFFQNALRNGWTSIFDAQIGYFNLLPNVAAYLATWVPLEAAPVVTTLFALLVHLVPLYLIFFGKIEFFDTTLKKAGAAAIVFFVAYHGEIILAICTSQFHFTIISFLILLQTKSLLSKGQKAGYAGITLVGGLTSIPAVFTAPFYVYRYLVFKEKYDLKLFGIYAFSLIVQLIAIFSLDRISEVKAPGFEFIGKVFGGVYQFSILHTAEIGIVTLFVLPLFYYIHVNGVKDGYVRHLFFGATLLFALIIFFAFDMKLAPRYYYGPSTMFVLLLFISAMQEKLKLLKFALYGYIALSLLIGLYVYPRWNYSSQVKDWPVWTEEVHEWRTTGDDTLLIHPQWEDGHKWHVVIKE